MARRARVAAVGGTFDRLHRGHRALLAVAFAAADAVAIGLTTAGYLAAHPKPYAGRIQPYAVRHRRLAAYLARTYPGRPHRIVPLRDPFGGALDPGVGLLVASAETRAGARAVNRERRRLGRAPLGVRLVPTVLGDDLRPLNATAIRCGRLDPEGHRRRPVVVAVVGARDPGERRAAARALAAALPRPIGVVVAAPRGAKTDAALARAARAGEYDYAVRLGGAPGRRSAVAVDAGGRVAPRARAAGPVARQLSRQFAARRRAWARDRPAGS